MTTVAIAPTTSWNIPAWAEQSEFAHGTAVHHSTCGINPSAYISQVDHVVEDGTQLTGSPELVLALGEADAVMLPITSLADLVKLADDLREAVKAYAAVVAQ